MLKNDLSKTSDRENLSFLDDVVKHFPLATKRRLPKEIVVVSVSARRSLALNREYRKKHTAANVLSFSYPALEMDNGKSYAPSVGGFKGGVYSKEYGEIIVCPAIIRREARAEKHTYEYQMTWMVVHGMIHLSGLHHEKSEEEDRRVSRIEMRILNKLFPLTNKR